MSNTDLVTGGAGFIGSHLCHALVERGRRVRVIDNLATGCVDNIEELLARTEAFEFHELDLLRAPLAQLLDGVETVYHQAAMVSVPLSLQDPMRCHEINVDATLRLFDAALQAGVRKVVYASSSAVYGESSVLPNNESMLPQPVSPYAVSKLSCELYGRVYAEPLGLPTVGLRYFNVFGPRQDPTSEYAAVIPKFVMRMLGGRAPIVFGDGEQTRDFIYVENVVRANLAAASADVSGVTLNVACGQPCSLIQLIARLDQILGAESQPRYEAPRAGEIRHSFADIDAARQLIGYNVDVSFGEGLSRTVDWFRQRTG